MYVDRSMRQIPYRGMGLVWPWEAEFWQTLIPRVEHPLSSVIPLTPEEKAQYVSPTAVYPKTPDIAYTGAGYSAESPQAVVAQTIPTAADILAANQGLVEVAGTDGTGDGGFLSSGIGWGWIVGLAAAGILVFAIASKRR